MAPVRQICAFLGVSLMANLGCAQIDERGADADPTGEAERAVVGVEIATGGTVILGEWALSWGTDSVVVVPADGEPFSAKADDALRACRGALKP